MKDVGHEIATILIIREVRGGYLHGWNLSSKCLNDENNLKNKI